MGTNVFFQERVRQPKIWLAIFCQPEACRYCTQENKQEVLLSSLSLWSGCGCVGLAVVAVAVVVLVSSAVSMSSSCSSHPSSYSCNIPIALPVRHLRPPSKNAWSSRRGFVIYVYPAQLGFTGAWIYIASSWEWPVRIFICNNQRLTKITVQDTCGRYIHGGFTLAWEHQCFSAPHGTPGRAFDGQTGWIRAKVWSQTIGSCPAQQVTPKMATWAKTQWFPLQRSSLSPKKTWGSPILQNPREDEFRKTAQVVIQYTSKLGDLIWD